VKVILARVSDIALIAMGATLAARLNFGHQMPHLALRGLFIAVIVGLAGLVFDVLGVYRSWRGRPTMNLVFRTLAGWLLVQACSGILLIVLDIPSVLPFAWLLTWTVLSAALLAGTRLLAYAALRKFRGAGFDVRGVAVVGSGIHFHRVIRDIDANRTAGFRLADVVELRAPGGTEEVEPHTDDDHELDLLIPLIH
jgi:putative colanic acid biosynthesis UDP-glucose lipid carrier transferase